MMPRRDRRSGVRFIEDSRDRSLTYFKRRSGLFKAASDLSTLTGARVAVVLESESGKFSSFGTPEASPILDSFLLGSAPTDLDTSEEEKAMITNLQNEVFQLEKDKTMEEKRKKESMERASGKKIQEASSSKVAMYAYSNIDDLEATELFEMYRELSRVKQEIGYRLPTLLVHQEINNKAGAAGGRLRDPSLLQPTWWRSSMPAPQVATPPPKYAPWSPLQACFQQHPWSSSSSSTSSPSSVLARSGSSSLPNSVTIPSPLIPQTPFTSSGVQFQASKMPTPPMEAHHPYSYHIHGIDINGSHSRSPFSLSPILSSSSTPQPSSLQTNPPSYDSSPLSSLSPPISSPLHVGSVQQLSFNVQNYNSVYQQPPHQNYANAGSTFFIHSHQPFYGILSPEPNNVELLGNIDNGGGGQAGGIHNEIFGVPSPQHSDGGGFDVVMPNSFSSGESSDGGGGGAGGNLGGLNLWY